MLPSAKSPPLPRLRQPARVATADTPSMTSTDPRSGASAAIAIRLVVGGNAILQSGNAHVLVYASADRQPVEIILPPRERWVRCVAPDFPVSYEDVEQAILQAGFVPVVSASAAVSSSSARG